jgi:hypothetical protein
MFLSLKKSRDFLPKNIKLPSLFLVGHGIYYESALNNPNMSGDRSTTEEIYSQL